MAISKSSSNGDGWHLLQVLGSGSFGQLSLWQEDKSKRIIAVKVCKLPATCISDRQREYWEKEVHIMYKLNHPNVVKAVELPQQLKCKLNTHLPPLGMEFCSGGDLRKVLGSDGNLCGLKEKDVRCVLQDICEGLIYLHGERIIHRDIKPENIVISTNHDSRPVYKIIDLGYAKQLEQSSQAQSFVGTLAYLAPELFEQPPKYTYTVDYWSFGILAFEVATGIRPFFHNESPIQWMQFVRQKRDSHIYATQTSKGKEFFSVLPEWCTLNEVLKADFTNWLRSMLAYDPKNRSPQGGATSLEIMLAFLKRKVAHVLNTSNQKVVVTVSADSGPDVLYTSTMVPVSAQLLISADGRELSFADLLEQGTPHMEDASITAYLFNLGGSYALTVSDLPRRVTQLLSLYPTSMAYAEQRWLWMHLHHHVDQEFLSCCRLQAAYRALHHYLSTLYDECKTKVNTLSSTYKEVKVLAQSLREDREYDLKHMKEVRHSALEELQPVLDDEAVNISQIRERMRGITAGAKVFYTGLGELRENPYVRTKSPEMLEALHRRVFELLKALRRRNNVERNQMQSNVHMANAVKEFKEEHARVLKELGSHIVDALQFLKALRETLRSINGFMEEVDKHYAKLKLHQQARRRAVWNVFKKLMIVTGDALDSGTGDGSQCDSITLEPNFNMLVRDNEKYRSALSSLNSTLECSLLSVCSMQSQNMSSFL